MNRRIFMKINLNEIPAEKDDAMDSPLATSIETKKKFRLHKLWIRYTYVMSEIFAHFCIMHLFKLLDLNTMSMIFKSILQVHKNILTALYVLKARVPMFTPTLNSTSSSIQQATKPKQTLDVFGNFSCNFYYFSATIISI